MHVAGELDFSEDAETPGTTSLNEQWIIGRDGSGVRASAEPGGDGEFTVPDGKLRALTRELDAIDFEYLDERYGAQGGDATTTALSYDDESLRVGDLFSELNDGEDEQADRLRDVTKTIARFG